VPPVASGAAQFRTAPPRERTDHFVAGRGPRVQLVFNP
jgi:hypothetical protein